MLLFTPLAIVTSFQGKGRGSEESRPHHLCDYRSVTGRLPSQLGRGDVIRLHALLALGRLVSYLGTLLEGLESRTRNTAVVNEEILTALVWGNEPVTLIVAEPLYRSLGHIWSPP